MAALDGSACLLASAYFCVLRGASCQVATMCVAMCVHMPCECVYMSVCICACLWVCVCVCVCAGVLWPPADVLWPQCLLPAAPPPEHTHTLLLIKSPVPWWATQRGHDGTHTTYTQKQAHTQTHTHTHTHMHPKCLPQSVC